MRKLQPITRTSGKPPRDKPIQLHSDTKQISVQIKCRYSETETDMYLASLTRVDAVVET